ncbi:MAG: hypothetical protein IKE94_04620 [Aeriscardovia sp.]|nr:hypothetical protein [Aeriscardovia sp.]
MVYSVTLYKNTGFNTINVPDSPALLLSAQQQTVQGIDILQDVVGSIRVRATWSDVEDADFAQVGNYYYSIPTGGVRMLAVDVAEISLVLNCFLSCGGIANLNILDGIAERAHVSTDAFGEWTAEDPLIAPSKPLELSVEVIPITQNANEDSTVFIESTINLPAMGLVCASSVFENITEQEVTVPSVIEKKGKRTKYVLDGKTGADTETILFGSDQYTSRGIEQCRALGLESVVLSKFSIPDIFFTLTAGSVVMRLDPGTYADSWIFDAIIVEATDDPNVVVTSNYHRVSTPADVEPDHTQTTQYSIGFVDTITGNDVTITPANLTFEYSSSYKNKRVLYGSYNRMGILTTGGNRLESNPEELVGGSLSGARIKAKADCHPDGAPYYRFEYMNGSTGNESFWLNAVKGLSWKKLPILWQGKTGSALDRINFQNERELIDYKDTQSITAPVKSFFGEIMDFFAGDNRNSGDFAAGYVNPLTGMETPKYMERKQEAQQFEISQRVVSPEVSITYDCEAFRDFYGECVVAYRYKPSATDLSRMDKILTMYGYKVGVPLEKSHFTNRQYFNYVLANATFTGAFPKWLLDGVSAELSGGIRVWHTLPDVSKYYDNPIV